MSYPDPPDTMLVKQFLDFLSTDEHIGDVKDSIKFFCDKWGVEVDFGDSGATVNYPWERTYG